MVLPSFAARFAAVRAVHGPLVWGLDPSGPLLESWGLGDSPQGLDRFLDLVRAQGLFLAPGVGGQGATPADVARVFAACPDRVMPSASRSLLVGGPDGCRLKDEVTALASHFAVLLPGGATIRPAQASSSPGITTSQRSQQSAQR